MALGPWRVVTRPASLGLGRAGWACWSISSTATDSGRARGRGNWVGRQPGTSGTTASAQTPSPGLRFPRQGGKRASGESRPERERETERHAACSSGAESAPLLTPAFPAAPPSEPEAGEGAAGRGRRACPLSRSLPASEQRGAGRPRSLPRLESAEEAQAERERRRQMGRPPKASCREPPTAESGPARGSEPLAVIGWNSARRC